MNLATKISGWLVASAWFVCAAFGLFYAYFLLTFYIFLPRTVAQNFRENRLAVIAWSLVAIAFLTGAVCVLLRRPWARWLSLILCALGVSFGAAEVFIGRPLDASTGTAIVVVLFSIAVWLFSRGGRTYFGRVAQTV